MAQLFSLHNKWIRRGGILLAVVPFFWIYSRLDFHKMVVAFPKVAWWTGPVLMTIVIASMTLQGIRWWILVKAFIPEVTFFRALSYHFIAVLYGTALPTSAAQDVIKTFMLANRNDSSASWAAIWMTRILGLPALGVLSAYGFVAMDKSSLPSGWVAGIVVFYLGAFLVFLVSFSKRLTRPFRFIIEKIAPVSVSRIISQVREGVYLYRNKKKDVLLAFAVTLLTQVSLVFSSLMTLKGITGHYFLWQCAAFVPLIELIAVSFPFTPNGMGVREMLNAAMSTYLGLTKEQFGIFVLFQFFFAYLPRTIGFLPVLHGYFKDHFNKG